MAEKLYYTDPLAAAYMAREFGIRLEGDIKWYNCADWASKSLADDRNNEIYIHPDSYHIFEPKMGDIVEWDGLMFGIVIGKDESDDTIGVQHGESDVYTIPSEELGIIQRNNKPFFNPQKEK